MKKDNRILRETKILHQKKENLSKIEIIEFSILFIILNYFELASKKIDDLSSIEFQSQKNEDLKNTIINAISQGNENENLKLKITTDYSEIRREIHENSNIQIITKNKSDHEVLELLDELVKDHKDQTNLKKIESLEKKLINNLDENSYTELIKLKSQLNRE